MLDLQLLVHDPHARRGQGIWRICVFEFDEDCHAGYRCYEEWYRLVAMALCLPDDSFIDPHITVIWLNILRLGSTGVGSSVFGKQWHDAEYASSMMRRGFEIFLGIDSSSSSSSSSSCPPGYPGICCI